MKRPFLGSDWVSLIGEEAAHRGLRAGRWSGAPPAWLSGPGSRRPRPSGLVLWKLVSPPGLVCPRVVTVNAAV